MHSIRTKITLTVVSVIILTVCIVAAIGVISIKKLGSDDADQMIHLTATTGAMNLEQYFESVVPTGSFSRKRDVDVNRLLATRSHRKKEA